MIYAWIACCVGCLFVGYLIGADKGYRKAHANIVAQQLKRSACGRPKCEKTGGCDTHRKDPSIKKPLHLVHNSNDDIGQW